MDNPLERAGKEFLADLEKSLRNLYDPLELRKINFIRWLGIQSSEDPAMAVRREIVNAINSLKPETRVQVDSPAKRIFQVLTYRFMEQTSQKEVATDLALSIRQLRRLEIQAIQLLAQQLLIRNPQNLLAKQPAKTGPLGAPAVNGSAHNEESELAWLRSKAEQSRVLANDLVELVIKTSEPLANRLKVRIRFEPSPNPILISAHLITIRQALLNILTVALQAAKNSELNVRFEDYNHYLEIIFQPAAPVDPSFSSANEIGENLELAKQLAQFSGGQVEIGSLDEPWVVNVRLPRLELTPVLVVDDNADALRLVERYLDGSRFRFLSTSNPAQAIAYAEESAPRLILLDVMLPDIDGWELLGRIREHPQLEKVPVIITTILPQETLALTLGAAGFLRKPFTQETLLQVLDHLADSSETESG